MNINIKKSTINEAIKFAKVNLCNVYFYEDGTFSNYRFSCPVGIIEYRKTYFELWLGQWKGLRFLA